MMLRYAFVLSFVIGNLAQAAASARPNVVFVISDDLTAEALSCYGNTQCQTPHIDALAQQGVRFTRAYCQFPVCGPSRAALMSGMYAQSIGVNGNGQSSRFTQNLGARPSLAQHFQSHGYYTARVSKIYHMRVPGDITAGVDGPDHAASWTERFNCQGPEWMSRGAHEHLTNERLKRDPDKHYGLGFGGAFYVVKSEGNGVEQPDVQAATKAVELIDAHRDEPFFLAVGLVRPHVPLVAPHAFFGPYPQARMTLVPQQADDWSDIPKAGISKNSKGMGLADNWVKQRKVLSAYYACVSFMDAQVGRIVAALERNGLRDRTIVVFTSDHGYHLGEHDLWQKMSLHEESTRIPLVISAPGMKRSVASGLAQQIDLYPTLVQLCGLAIPGHCQGRSLVPLLEDPAQSVHEQVYCFKGNGHLWRTDRWAFISYKDGSSELYDMRNDPQQFTNLTEHEGHREVVRSLKQQLNAFVAGL